MKLLNGKCIENEFQNNFVNKSCHYNSFLLTILFISDLITIYVPIINYSSIIMITFLIEVSFS